MHGAACYQTLEKMNKKEPARGFQILLLNPLGLNMVEVNPEILFLDPEGTQGS